MLKLIALLLCLLALGCSQSGGGDNPLGGTPADDSAFQQAAIDRALSETLVECDTVVCGIADDSQGFTLPDGSLDHECAWFCIDATVSLNGVEETRSYVVNLRFQSEPLACFMAEAQLLAAFESPDPCLSNRERF